MKKYLLYFEVNGKKLKMYVDAKDKSNAKQKVIDRFIVFRKIEGDEDGDEDGDKDVNFFKDFFGFR